MKRAAGCTASARAQRPPQFLAPGAEPYVARQVGEDVAPCPFEDAIALDLRVVRGKGNADGVRAVLP